ncbi:DUF2878 domain-containing protein [Thalassotalea sp. M1531]|uniref:DUF2878 domain-containing protein n=1 Tax=Thalassotalea algicola TaxID=2716224 RepID=A0A7Y0LCD4_9GAMM|nr:DUF2878 domain-containing protein [Thalassotalea algicola]NMP31583.1 DUF2878 domain-containing protein [Thalassotalea algicola]
MLLNALLFNISWFGLILMGNSFIPFTFLWLAVHFYQCENVKKDLTIVAWVTFIGVVTDSTLTLLGVFEFSSSVFIIPFWLVALWMSFAATLNHSLRLVANSKLAQKFVGLIGVPLSYFAGQKLGAVKFGFDVIPSLVILGFVWFYLFSFFMSLTKKENVGYA